MAQMADGDIRTRTVHLTDVGVGPDNIVERVAGTLFTMTPGSPSPVFRGTVLGVRLLAHFNQADETLTASAVLTVIDARKWLCQGIRSLQHR